MYRDLPVPLSICFWAASARGLGVLKEHAHRYGRELCLRSVPTDMGGLACLSCCTNSSMANIGLTKVPRGNK